MGARRSERYDREAFGDELTAFYKSVCTAISKIRKERGWSRPYVADLCNVSTGMIRKIDRQEVSTLMLETFVKICGGLGIKMSSILPTHKVRHLPRATKRMMKRRALYLKYGSPNPVEALRDEVIKLRKKGYTFRAIKAKTGANLDTIYKILHPEYHERMKKYDRERTKIRLAGKRLRIDRAA